MLPTGNNTHQYFDPPDIRMPVGFGASLSFLNATSNPRLAPVEEPTSGLELVKGSSLPDSIGRAAPKYNENRSIVRCDTIQYFGAHTGSVPTQDASDTIRYRWVDLIPSPNVSLDIPRGPWVDVVLALHVPAEDTASFLEGLWACDGACDGH